ncbi:molybdate ABC transporter substrate-binding protein [Vibrio sp. IRLE0018]|uniref:molybdate ABC transporter substrate-binding protein n=1 Tax=Vibrio TaxID=662 RepID=UPI0015942FEA|nr:MULTISPECIES: molybdate ABC transporter substrate-binding protein [Vibrio]MBN8101575.1 molybdate ABC transporter substrate-binding protein [Vibrio vulnificus]MCF8777915.1 molybdate ABC transporter substrate-binding protein [Vibrio floridensis]NVC64215.1 molybdate ABC transporter substrate-binding protein [Vibrio sp. 05-20-BW147]
MMNKWLSLLLLMLAPAVSAQQTTRIYAASSLTNAINDVIESYERQNHQKVQAIYGGSSSLSRQLLSGAPGDIFISANNQWMDYLLQHEVIKSDSVTNLLSNKLVVITNKNNNVTLDVSSKAQWQRLLTGNWLALGDTNSVPAGMYAKQMLQNADVWNAVSSHVAPSKNVRLALALVERDEAKLGIVYQTDARMSQKVKILVTPEQALYDPITYPAGLITQSESAKAFFNYLMGPEATAIFQKHGFTTLEKS